jgi:putative DNA primase/helicase
MGYALIPSNALQAFLLLTGDGANGKSAFLTGICAAFGPENISNISLESFTERFAIANFYGKQLNIVDDLSEVDRTAEGKLKSIVSGSWMSADRKNKDILNFCPTLKLIFACNIEPRFRDTTSGLLRRMKKIPFNRTIPENERRPEFCTMEYWHPNRAAIMNWCLRGLIQLMDNGMKFTYCQSIEEAKDQYRLEMNPVLQFIQEYLIEEPGRSVAVGSVYHVYSQWCGRNGYKQLNNVNFSKELYRVFRSVSRVRKRSSMKLSYYFQNLKFNPEADIPSEF